MPSSPQPADLYVGLMSGTSMDGIDAALVRFGDHDCEVVATHSSPYPQDLQSQLLLASRNPESFSIDKLGALDNWTAECFGKACDTLLDNAAVEKSRVAAIGSHGQTLRHQPLAERPFTLQIGDPNIIAARTGLATVADFRRRDVALGGHGAPLAPAFHQWLFAGDQQKSAVVNIGGIANVTLLAAQPHLTRGFDTGPGNTLLDAWSREKKSLPYDKSGNWARSGQVVAELLQRFLDDPYFALPPPKSTGFEYFNLLWLQKMLQGSGGPAQISEEDVQATLAELTARSIADAIRLHGADTECALICGGGVHNGYLMSRLRAAGPNLEFASTADAGLDPDWVEAAAFAWLAMRTLAGQSGNLPSVTGAESEAVLGGVYYAQRGA